MADISEAIGGAFHAAETGIEKTYKLISHLYSAVDGKLAAFAKDEPAEMASLREVLRTGEIFLAAATPAISARGLSLPADSAAFAALGAFVGSFESAASTFRAATGIAGPKATA